MTSTEDSISNFDRSICELAEQTGSIPHGWIGPFMSSLVNLFAVRCARRSHILLSRAVVADISLVITQDANDQVVAGIIRKLAATTACTCEQCARAGLLRILGKKLQVLCPVCAAPRLMLYEIDSLSMDQASTNSQTVSTRSYDEVPAILRSTIPTSSWEVRRGECELTLHITNDEMKRLRPRFETVRQALNAEITRQVPK